MDLSSVEGCKASAGPLQRSQRRKEILGEIDLAKKRSNCGDKKAKKIEAKLISNLRKELRDLQVETEPAPSDGVDDSDGRSGPVSSSEGAINKRPSKAAQRRRRRMVEQDMMNNEALEKIKSSEDLRAREIEEIEKATGDLNLEVYDIKADGSCLYNSISDQLKVTGYSVCGSELDASDLRRIASDELLSNSSTYLPYLLSDEGEPMSMDQYKEYCDNVKLSDKWGGYVEMVAISRRLKREIFVVCDGKVSGVGITPKDGECSGTPVYISFHRHYYKLGEHYNSLRPRDYVPTQ